MNHRNINDCAGEHSHVWNKVLINLIISKKSGGIKCKIKKTVW